MLGLYSIILVLLVDHSPVKHYFPQRQKSRESFTSLDFLSSLSPSLFLPLSPRGNLIVGNLIFYHVSLKIVCVACF